MIDDASFRLLVIAWLTVAVFTVLLHQRNSRSSAGLVLTWLLALGLIHWLAAAMYALPWFAPSDDGRTQLGLLQSLYAVGAFGFGVLFLSPLLRMVDPPFRAQSGTLVSRGAAEVAPRYLIIGSLAYFVLGGFVSNVPTLNSVVSTGLDLAVGGLCLGASAAIISKQTRSLAGWFALSAVFPIATLVTAGFLGFGAFAVLSFVCFVAVWYRPRGRVLVVGVIVTYLALTIFVTYMRDRGNIRESVWGGASFSDRLDQVSQSVTTFEWFDPTNTDHLARINGRLNQNYLVGAGVIYLEEGNRDFARGQTIWGAVVAVVPRVIWPEKPIVAGGSTLVSEYTGLDFAYGTSVGVGLVLEFYLNFGTPGVVVGFLVIGTILGALDRAAGQALAKGDLEAFTLRYVPALAFMDIGNSLGVLTSRALATLVMVYVINRFVLPIFWQDREKIRTWHVPGPDGWVQPVAAEPVASGKQQVAASLGLRRPLDEPGD